VELVWAEIQEMNGEEIKIGDLCIISHGDSLDEFWHLYYCVYVFLGYKNNRKQCSLLELGAEAKIRVKSWQPRRKSHKLVKIALS